MRLRASVAVALAVAGVAVAVAPALGARIAWHPTWQDALKAAKKNGRLAYIFVYLPGRATCAQMNDYTFGDAKVRQEMKLFECGAVDASTKEGADFVNKYKMEYLVDKKSGVKLATVPGHLFVRPDGTVLDRQYGYIPAPGFIAMLERERSLDKLKAAAKADPKDPKVAADLGHLLLLLDHQEEGRRELEMAIALDPDNAEHACERARLDLAILQIKRDPDMAAQRLRLWLNDYGSGDDRVEAEFYLACAYVAGNHNDEAIKVLEPFKTAKKGTPEADTDWGARGRGLLAALQKGVVGGK